MTEKVVLTKEQAKAIEEFQKTVHELGISLDELKGIFESGYEVKPEFEENNWVYDMQHNKVARIDHRGVDDNRVWVDDEDFNFFAIVNIRHATPEEIAEEKERRWWKDIGRNVKEYEIGDVVTYSNSAGLYEITRVFSEDGVLISNDLADSEIDVSVNEIKLVVPYENRLDVK